MTLRLLTTGGACRRTGDSDSDSDSDHHWHDRSPTVLTRSQEGDDASGKLESRKAVTATGSANHGGSLAQLQWHTAAASD